MPPLHGFQNMSFTCQPRAGNPSFYLGVPLQLPPLAFLVHSTLFSSGLDVHGGPVHIFRILRVFSIAHCVCFFYRRATFEKGAFRCLVNPSRLHLPFSRPTTNARFLLPSVRAALLTTNLFTY